MEHEIGSGSPAPGCQARSAEGVMVRRLSVACLDSGAESPVYGEEPSASADRGLVVNPPRADGGGRQAAGAMPGDTRHHDDCELGHFRPSRNRDAATRDKL
jgi:hypothetical protein